MLEGGKGFVIFNLTRRCYLERLHFHLLATPVTLAFLFSEQPFPMPAIVLGLSALTPPVVGRVDGQQQAHVASPLSPSIPSDGSSLATTPYAFRSHISRS